MPGHIYTATSREYEAPLAVFHKDDPDDLNESPKAELVFSREHLNTLNVVGIDITQKKHGLFRFALVRLNARVRYEVTVTRRKQGRIKPIELSTPETDIDE